MPKDMRLLGVDVGAQSIRVCVFDGHGNVLGSFQKPLEIDRPHRGWAEADPETWWQAFLEGVGHATEQAKIRPETIGAIGISNMCPSLVAMDGKGRALRPAILYQDQRSLEQVETVQRKSDPERIFELSGNRAAAGTYSVSSMRWIQDHEPAIFSKTVYFGHANTFLGSKLTGKVGLDHTNASFTGLFQTGNPGDLGGDEGGGDSGGGSGGWSGELISAWGIAGEKLPPLVRSWSRLGELTHQAAAAGGFRECTPVAIGAADSACSALGAGITEPQQGFNTAGSSDVLLFCIDQPNFDKRFMNRCHAVPGRWLAMGALLSAGAAFDWLRQKILSATNYDVLNEEAQQSGPGANHLIFLPYMQGERSPIWDPMARGVFFGLSLESTRGDLARAVMEGAAFALRQNLEIASVQLGYPVGEIRLGGGGAKSDLWCQIKADVLDRPLVRLDKEETAVLGAAMLAGIAAGLYRDHHEAVELAAAKPDRVFTPRPEQRSLYNGIYEIYCGLYPRLADPFYALGTQALARRCDPLSDGVKTG